MIPNKVKRLLREKYIEMLDNHSKNEIDSMWIVTVYDMPPFGIVREEMNDQCISISLDAAKAMGALLPGKGPSITENGPIKSWEATTEHKRYHFLRFTPDMMKVLWINLYPIGHMEAAKGYDDTLHDMCGYIVTGRQKKSSMGGSS